MSKQLYYSHGKGIECDYKERLHLRQNINIEEGVRIFNTHNISFGNNCYIGHDTLINGYNKLNIGTGSWIGPQVYIHSAGEISIGDNVGIGCGVKIVSSSHKICPHPKPIIHSELIFDIININNGCDIGVNATILPGTILGKNVQVGAGAVVKGTFPDNVVIAGVPAKIIRYINNSDENEIIIIDKVEYFDYSKLINDRIPEIMKNIENVLRNDKVILGKEVEILEDKINTKTNTKYSVCVSSGTDAILVLLLSLNLKKKEVIVPTFTFAATIEAIILAGLTPKIIDIGKDSFHIDYNEIKKHINDNTGAILFVQLFGELKDLSHIKQYTNKNNIYLLEDTAQAFGAYNSSIYPGSQSDAAIFSFFPNKSLGTAGDAGAIVTNNKNIYDKCKAIRNHGSIIKYKHEYIGGTFRINTLQAGILNILLDDFDNNTNKRLKNFNLYYDNLKNINQIKLPELYDGHTLSVMTIICEKRNDLFDYLQANNIETFKYWPEGMHKQNAFKKYIQNENNYINCDTLCEEVLSIPIYPCLTKEQIIYVSKNIINFYENNQ
jgi:dTDP-4-amino-4,6-dideoxygalactose transaminase/acetyltransferase-like isoleucine patch superfamily enzyme